MIYDKVSIQGKIGELISDIESETVEFKEAKSNFGTDELGKYFSALSNEANLKGFSEAWLLFGIDDKGRVVGSNYRNDATGKSSLGLSRLKVEIAEHTNDRMTFSEIYETELDGKRIVAFQIPPARRGVPTTWKLASYERKGDRLEPLSLPKIDEIRAQKGYDWSGDVAAGSSLDDLDPDAVSEIRNRLNAHYGNKSALIKDLDDASLLEKFGITVDNVPTNAGLILAGRSRSSRFLNGLIPQISWSLYDSKGDVDSLEHLEMPLVLAVNRLLSLIRNNRFLLFENDDSINPKIQLRYDAESLREVVYNCIAHQDYSLRGKINVLEYEHRLVFMNEGSFIPRSLDEVLSPEYRPPRYRNPALVQIMMNLGYIDVIASGIQRIFSSQIARCMPLPDYDLTDPNRVKVTLYGSELNKTYTRIMATHPDMPISLARVLDDVQKNRSISENHYEQANKDGFLAGDKDNPMLVFNEAADAERDEAQSSYENAPFSHRVTEHSAVLNEEGAFGVIEAEPGISRSKILARLGYVTPEDGNLEKAKRKLSYLLKRLENEGRIEGRGKGRGRRWFPRDDEATELM